MTVVQTIVSTVSALGGGFVGGLLVAFRLGGWRQRVEDHLAALERRVERTDGSLESISVLTTRVELLIEELRTLRAEIRQDRQVFVTHEECDRRHK